ncbi:hypothetical protein BBJ28_00006168 [Nothophytophthora sp. Chile5]|nr:hypothetical protein BBJ28_00006168 [Nothophytophthora sp. Chile5]
MRRRLVLLPVRCLPPRHCPQLLGRWYSIAALTTASPSQQDWRQAVADFQRKAGDAHASLLPEDVENVVQLCAANDRAREALDVVHRSEKRGVMASLESHVQICCALARKGNADRALAMVPELHARFGEQLQAEAAIQQVVYGPLLSVFKGQGDWRSTHAAIAQMHELGLPPPLRAFRVLMVAAAKARRKDMLLTTVAFVEKQFPESQSDVRTLTAISQALVDIDEPQRVLELYRKLDGDWLHEHGNTILFNQFLLAAIRSEDGVGSSKNQKTKHKKKPSRKESASDMQLAMDIFDQMCDSRNAAPDDFTFATCMVELEKRGQWGEVLDLYNTMQNVQTRNDSTLSETVGKPVINALSCSAVIQALHNLQGAKQQQGEDHQTQQPGGDEASVPLSAASSKARKSAKRGLTQDLDVVLKQLPVVELRNVGHASTLIDTLDEFRLFTAARQVFTRMLDEGVIRQTPWRQKDGFEIDLHTFSRGVAKCAVVSAFDEITRMQKGSSDASLVGNAPLQDLRIITGVGKRSQTYLKPVLKQEITELLSKSSRPPLWPSAHPTNPGVLLVRHNALRKWLQKGGTIRYF